MTERLIPDNTVGVFLIPFFGKISTRQYFILVFVLQVLLIFQGLDLSDEGFLSTFYSRIFNNPSSVSYCFMFWLTGIIGGAWVKLFSPLGLLGIRLCGALVNTLTIILTFNLLKKYLNPGNLKLGLFLVVLSLNNDIKILNYNTLSSLFFLIIINLLFNGLLNKHLGKILFSGFFVGLNIFIRTPNLLALGLVSGIFYYNFLAVQPKIFLLKQIFSFLLGFLAAICCVFLVMYLMGHLPIFLRSMNLLYTLGKGAKNPEVQSGYGFVKLLDLFRSNIVVSLKYIVMLLIIVFGFISFFNRPENKSKLYKYTSQAVVTLFIFELLFLILDRKIDQFTFLFFINGLIILTAVSVFKASTEKEIKLLFFFGCFFLLSYPFGSSDGIYTAGRYCLWIALPITMDYLLKIQSTAFDIAILRDKKEYFIKLLASEKQITNLKKLLTYSLVFAGFYYVYFYPFFDRRNRLQMHYPLRCDNLKGIYTTKGRAEMFNELLDESKKYVKANDYVIAYDNIALFYYASNTIPLLTNPLPNVYSSELFRADINSIHERSIILPPVIMQKIATVGPPASKWPEETLPGDYFKTERNLERNNILDSFLSKNNYKEVWSNKVFKILMPEGFHLHSR